MPDPSGISGELVSPVAEALPRDAVPGAAPLGMRRYVVLAASVLMLVFLGTGQAWSVFIAPLKSAFQFSDSQLQLVFTTNTFTFCFVIILGGRLHDRFGPRPLAVVSAALVATGWGLAATAGARYLFLWLGVGFLVSAGSAMGYVCPLATAIKWFPKRAGLIAGLAAAGFGLGPVLLSNTVELLLRHGWPVLRVFGLVASVWAPVVLATGLLLFLPPEHRHAPPLPGPGFRRRMFATDRRFWGLFAGMFFGTLPYLVVMGSVKPLGTSFGIGQAAAFAISVVAVGNASGRIFWGYVVDRLATRRTMLAAQSLMIVSVVGLMLGGRLHPALFLIAVCGVGFAYGGNFAIYPSTVSRLYGVRLFGSVYPLVMAAQGFSSLASTVNGVLYDRTGSYVPGLTMAAGLAAVGLITGAILSKAMSAPTVAASAGR